MSATRPTYRNIPLRAAFVLLVAVLFSTHLLGNLSAKFIVGDPQADSARVAAFSFNLTDGASSHVVDLSKAIEKPGDAKSFAFNVNGASEVSRRYWLQVRYDGSLPLEFKVTQNSTAGANAGGAFKLATTIAQLNAAITTKGGHVPEPLEATSTKVTLPPNSGNEKYTLTATWPASENQPDYANNSVGELTLFAICEQID